mgnify:CR=1 FL=1
MARQKRALWGGGITGSDLENVKTEAVNEAVDEAVSQSKNYTDSKVNGLDLDKSNTTRITVQPFGGVNLSIIKWTDLKLCQAQLSGRFPSPTVQTTTSSQVVPAAYRPRDEARTVGFIGGVLATMSLNTNGSLFFWAASTTGANSEFTANFVYRTSS